MCIKPSHFCHTYKSITLEKSLVWLVQLGKLIYSTASVTPKKGMDGSHLVRKKRKGNKSGPRLSPFWAWIFIGLFRFFVLFCFALLLLFWGFGVRSDCFYCWVCLPYIGALQWLKCERSFRISRHALPLTNASHLLLEKSQWLGAYSFSPDASPTFITTGSLFQYKKAVWTSSKT